MTRSSRAFVTTATALAAAFLIALVAQYGPGGLRAKLDAHLAFWPQQWSFFTGLDRDVVTGYHVLDETGRLSAFDDGWYEGFTRTSHARTQDIRQMARRVPDEYWQLCAGIIEARCTEAVDNRLVFLVVNRARRTELCGRIALAVERPNRPEHADRIAFVDMICAR